MDSLRDKDESGDPDSLRDDDETDDWGGFADSGDTLPQQERIRIARENLFAVEFHGERSLIHHMNVSAMLFLAHREIWANPDIPADERLNKLIEEAARYGLKYKRSTILEYERLHVLRSDIWAKCQSDQAIAKAKGLVYEFPTWQKALAPFKPAKPKPEPTPDAPPVATPEIATKALEDLEKVKAELHTERDRIFDLQAKANQAETLAQQIARIRQAIEEYGDDSASIVIEISHIIGDATPEPPEPSSEPPNDLGDDGRTEGGGRSVRLLRRHSLR